MNRSYEGFRILLVHAHPDDETINNGATMALHADRGAHVTLVTCTRGEEGEVLVPSLSHLASSQKDQLGTHRETELADAMKALGISDYRFLGAPSVSSAIAE
jgi:N-acetyl-1-D-myo-inositol-2-amino-2-deoxy-alpha-D-glucopyranoside deacetylase